MSYKSLFYFISKLVFISQPKPAMGKGGPPKIFENLSVGLKG